jgi:hypothetical protein
MTYHQTEKRDTRFPGAPKGERSCPDYSEEAIPERDPAYHLPEGTLYNGQTVEVMPADVRLALASCLERLGMSASRAALIATL